MNRFQFFAATAVIVSLAFYSGCGTDAKEVTPNNGEQADGDGHNHGPDGHSHDEGHTHGPGPHDGTIADWGGGAYHVEFTVDHEKQEATVYILGDDQKSPAPVQAESIELSIVDPEMQVTLNAAPQDGDPEGSSSRFSGTHEKLATVQEYQGAITGVVDGTPYTGEFKEEPHGHEH